MRFVLLGAGFWARYQLAAWGEQPGVECVAVVDPDGEKTTALARAHGITGVYTDAAEALDATRPDFADIVTPVETHAPLARLCMARGIPAIVQKPLAPALAEAESLVADAEAAGVTLLVHENWRWQTPLREAGALLHAGRIGRVFRARLSFVTSFPVFDNQPFLATLPQFILTDIGSHVLDAARFLFGEARSVYAETHRVNSAIQGEDVATVVMPMARGGDSPPATVVCEMSYASATPNERFPQTFLFVEGERGSLEIGTDFNLRITDVEGRHDAHPTVSRRVPPPRYAWADPVYDLVQASMVPCQSDLLAHLRGERTAETTAADNLRSVRLVFAAYDSAHLGQVILV
jgi:predicted dehydrogenase